MHASIAAILSPTPPFSQLMMINQPASSTPSPPSSHSPIHPIPSQNQLHSQSSNRIARPPPLTSIAPPRNPCPLFFLFFSFVNRAPLTTLRSSNERCAYSYGLYAFDAKRGSTAMSSGIREKGVLACFFVAAVAEVETFE